MIGQTIARSVENAARSLFDELGIAYPDGLAAIRYYLLRFGLLTEAVFDIQQATEVTGNSGVYLMYSHARAASILSKDEEARKTKPSVPGEIDRLEKAEYALLRHLAGWQDALRVACVELAPNVVCNYAHELALLFNNFYAACPILKKPTAIRKRRSG